MPEELVQLLGNISGWGIASGVALLTLGRSRVLKVIGALSLLLGIAAFFLTFVFIAS